MLRPDRTIRRNAWSIGRSTRRSRRRSAIASHVGAPSLAKPRSARLSLIARPHMTRLLVTNALFLLTGTLVGCDAGFATNHDAGTRSPRHTSAEAIQIALRQWPDLSDNLSKYDPPTAKYEAGSGTWWIYFHDKAAALDGCFYLQLDDRTDKLSKRVITCG